MTVEQMVQRESPRVPTAPARRFGVRFLLSNNLPGSVTRIVADTASVLARGGVVTTVVFPGVNWWDFKVFAISRVRGLRRAAGALKLAGDVAAHAVWRVPWCGIRFHPVDQAVRTERFLAVPSASCWEEDTVTVVHPPYLIPHLLRRLRRPSIPMVSAVHVNLEKAMQSPSPEAAAWFTHWVAMERLIAVPRYATSAEGRAAAERVGIPIRVVIPNGIDLQLFHPRAPNGRERAVIISLYCDPNVQKGLRVGVEALRGLKTVAPRVHLQSIGRVTREQAGVFDRNLGYLHGEAYAEALRGSDIFVYPSLYDGFPAPPVQAMASGAAVVTTAVAGVEDYAAHGENALLCDPGNADALRRQVLRLLHDETLRNRLRMRGPETALAFGVEQRARELLGFLTEVYEEWHSRPGMPVRA